MEAICLYAIDFEYDGRRLSDYGFIVCQFNGGSGTEIAEAGSKITFDTIPISNGRKYSIGGIKYEECYSTTFHICKDQDLYDGDDRYITSEEFSNLARWLNRKDFLRFAPIDKDNPFAHHVYYYASFTLAKIKLAERCCGVELKMETNSPFGFGEVAAYTLDFTQGNLSKTFEDISDEIGFLYPKITITCKQAGEIKLSSDLGRCQSVISNCANNEVITMSGESKIISTSVPEHDIANDFNYDFFRVGNKLDSQTNTVTASAPCTVVIEYEPIIKDTV